MARLRRRQLLILAIAASLPAQIGVSQDDANEQEGDAPNATRKQRLDGGRRARMLAALAGITILGGAMVLLTWLAGRMTRRYMKSGLPTKLPPTDMQLLSDDWAARPLAPEELKRLDEEDLLQ